MLQSTFLSPGQVTERGQLASLHLSRDSSLPVLLATAAFNAQDDGYAEGVVTNTKFGSFPHSTLIQVPWGSQVRASKVDTGSRGRREQHAGKKRKAEAISDVSTLRQATTAESGFIHVLPPTPENWTTSLPHRTQVVYTPDYSYILHRIRARPGSVLIEAGSGSGSFTHAAARAVFDGGPTNNDEALVHTQPDAQSQGKVFTYEYHLVRHEKVQIEMEEHGLTPIVTATHRNVYKDGFLLKNGDGQLDSPMATAVFLDLPAPWEALPHLSRSPEDGSLSSLDPTQPVHICTFSPCIEQTQKTISALRRLGWIEVEMVRVQHERVEVRREFMGMKYDGMRGVNVVPATVEEAVAKLQEQEQRALEFNANKSLSGNRSKIQEQPSNFRVNAPTTLFKEGQLVHRSEPDLKTHTSYLVFALLPREWSEDDEAMARQSLEAGKIDAPKMPKSQRQLKKEAKNRKKQSKEDKTAVNGIHTPAVA